MYTLLNGHKIPAELAQLPLSDCFGADTLAVTVRLYHAVPFRLDSHVQILASALAAPESGYRYALNCGQIARELSRLIADNQLYNGAATLAVFPASASARTAITLTPFPDSLRPGAPTILTATAARRFHDDPMGALPYVHLPWNAAASAAAARVNADAGIVHDENGNALYAVYAHSKTPQTTDINAFSGGTAALFGVQNGALITPDPMRNHLPANIMQQAVAEVAAREGVVVYYESLTSEILAEASGIFLADAVREIVPVTAYGGKIFPEHPIITRLQNALKARIAAETNG